MLNLITIGQQLTNFTKFKFKVPCFLIVKTKANQIKLIERSDESLLLLLLKLIVDRIR